ncbi:hypothetical protein GN956_G10136 [Arapaima gigas]
MYRTKVCLLVLILTLQHCETTANATDSGDASCWVTVHMNGSSTFHVPAPVAEKAEHKSCSASWTIDGIVKSVYENGVFDSHPPVKDVTVASITTATCTASVEWQVDCPDTRFVHNLKCSCAAPLTHTWNDVTGAPLAGTSFLHHGTPPAFLSSPHGYLLLWFPVMERVVTERSGEATTATAPPHKTTALNGSQDLKRENLLKWTYRDLKIHIFIFIVYTCIFRVYLSL